MSARGARPAGQTGVGPVKVLLVGHDASRTGTPRLVASLARWLVEGDHAVHIALDRGGPLQGDLEAVAPVAVVDRAAGRSSAERALLAARELHLGALAGRAERARRRHAVAGAGRPDLVWLHGAASLRWLDALPAGAPVVAHIHELAVGIDRSLAGLDAGALLRRADLLVAVSGAVADHLVDGRGVDPTRVRVHPGWVPDPPVPPTEARRPPGVPAEAVLVGGCGSIGWRKGSDLLAIAAQIAPATVGGRPLHWAWLGGGAPHERADLHREVRARGLEGRFHLLGERDDPGAWIAGFDVFALTSREDPFPLVALEAGAAGVPVTAFASGGVVELLRGVAGADGLVVDLLDVEALAGTVVGLAGNGDERAAIGRALRERVRSRHHAEVAIPLLWADVSSVRRR